MTGLVALLVYLLRLYQLIILVRVILSWMQLSPYHPIMRLICPLTDPLLDAARRAFPVLHQGGFDFTPILAIFLLQVIQNVLIQMAA